MELPLPTLQHGKSGDKGNIANAGLIALDPRHYQILVEQVTAGGVNPQLLDEIRLNVADLRRLLLTDKVRRFSMPLTVYEDAERSKPRRSMPPAVTASDSGPPSTGLGRPLNSRQ